MIALLLRAVGKLGKTHAGRAILTAGVTALALFALWQWHEMDKAAAVAAARDGYVQEVELAAVRVERDSLRARLAAERDAALRFEEARQVAEGEARRLAEDIERFADAPVDPACVVDDDLFDRLRAR